MPGQIGNNYTQKKGGKRRKVDVHILEKVEDCRYSVHFFGPISKCFTFYVIFLISFQISGSLTLAGLYLFSYSY